MALTLTIGGSNFLPQYKTSSARVHERMGNKVNSMGMIITKKSGQSVPQHGQEIIFKDGSRFLFGGYVTKVEPAEIGEGQYFIYKLEAVSYEYLMVNKVAQEVYENKTLAFIVGDLLTNYVDSGYGILTTGVQTGPTIETISFNHINLRKCFEKLSKVTGYEWYIGYDKVLYFRNKEYEFAPEQITDSSDNYSDIAITYDTTQIRNSIIVKGGREEASTNLEEEFLCDGVAEKWILREKPKSMVDVEYDTGGGYSSQNFGVDPLDDETGNDFMFNYQEKYVRVTSTTGTPADGNKIRVTYGYEIPVITKLLSATSIAAMQAIEGGDGVHSYTIKDTSITSKQEARLRALKELDEYAEPMLNGQFTTRTGLLTAGSIFAPGQLLTVNLPTWNINSDTDYLIQEVVITMVEDGSNIEYNYSVRFGGRMFGLREFLENLGGEEKVVLETEEIDTIRAISETLAISEVITKDGNLQSVTETLTLSEAVYNQEITPPFQYTNYIGDFEDTLDGFSLGCGGIPTSSYVTGRKGLGKGIKIWSTGGDGLACMNKSITDVSIGDKFRFWAKGWPRHQLYTGSSVNIQTTRLSTGQTVSGATIHNLYNSFNGGAEFTEWEEFEVEVLANATGVKWWLYNKGSTGEANASYYDKLLYGNNNAIWNQAEWS